MFGPLGPEDPAQPDALRWPAGFSPECSDVWARGELAVQAAPAAVFSRLIAVSDWQQDFRGIRNVRGPEHLEPDAEFEFELNGLHLSARVIECVKDARLAWSAQGIDISAYQAWVVSGHPIGSRILAGYAARGAAAVALRETNPDAAQATLDRWLADLR
jgi:hypothetical protein